MELDAMTCVPQVQCRASTVDEVVRSVTTWRSSLTVDTLRGPVPARSLDRRMDKVTRLMPLHAERREHFAPVESHAHRDCGALDAHGNVGLIAPALLGLRRAEKHDRQAGVLREQYPLHLRIRLQIFVMKIRDLRLNGATTLDLFAPHLHVRSSIGSSRSEQLLEQVSHDARRVPNLREMPTLHEHFLHKFVRKAHLARNEEIEQVLFFFRERRCKLRSYWSLYAGLVTCGNIDLGILVRKIPYELFRELHLASCEACFKLDSQPSVTPVRRPSVQRSQLGLSGVGATTAVETIIVWLQLNRKLRVNSVLLDAVANTDTFRNFVFTEIGPFFRRYVSRSRFLNVDFRRNSFAANKRLSLCSDWLLRLHLYIRYKISPYLKSSQERARPTHDPTLQSSCWRKSSSMSGHRDLLCAANEIGLPHLWYIPYRQSFRTFVTNHLVLEISHLRAAETKQRSGFNPKPGYAGLSHMRIVSDDAVGRGGFSGISRFPPSPYSGAAPYPSLPLSLALAVKGGPNLCTHTILRRSAVRVDEMKMTRWYDLSPLITGSRPPLLLTSTEITDGLSAFASNKGAVVRKQRIFLYVSKLIVSERLAVVFPLAGKYKQPRTGYLSDAIISWPSVPSSVSEQYLTILELLTSEINNGRHPVNPGTIIYNGVGGAADVQAQRRVATYYSQPARFQHPRTGYLSDASISAFSSIGTIADVTEITDQRNPRVTEGGQCVSYNTAHASRGSDILPSFNRQVTRDTEKHCLLLAGECGAYTLRAVGVQLKWIMRCDRSVIRASLRGFRRPCPTNVTVSHLLKEFNRTGSIRDGECLRRPSLPEDTVERIQEAIERSPRASTRHLSRELDVPPYTWRVGAEGGCKKEHWKSKSESSACVGEQQEINCQANVGGENIQLNFVPRCTAPVVVSTCNTLMYYGLWPEAVKAFNLLTEQTKISHRLLYILSYGESVDPKNLVEVWDDVSLNLKDYHKKLESKYNETRNEVPVSVGDFVLVESHFLSSKDHWYHGISHVVPALLPAVTSGAQAAVWRLCHLSWPVRTVRNTSWAQNYRKRSFTRQSSLVHTHANTFQITLRFRMLSHDLTLTCELNISNEIEKEGNLNSWKFGQSRAQRDDYDTVTSINNAVEVPNELYNQIYEDFELLANSEDSLVLIQAWSRKDLEEKAEDILNKVENWGRTVELELFVEKTNMIILKRIFQRTPVIRFRNYKIITAVPVNEQGVMDEQISRQATRNTNLEYADSSNKIGKRDGKENHSD
ncbi:hypothetical protein PR048_033161 [Dryococelus australis]|uniref:DUF4817 domain-containing protein n=1 Tax=Dryococelus australis TaxID=614101 RepID=A0ABQ9FZH0_9NEOP|nr:hypothetical protein PR048_033161 [Dryococelus australis]